MELTLKDLAKKFRFEPRTIRSYIEKGLLPGPEGAGRSAAYSDRHMHRLRIINARRRQGWALEPIRRQLLGMTELEIRELSEALSAEEQAWTKKLDELPASPLDYVKAVQARRADESWKRPSDFAEASMSWSGDRMSIRALMNPSTHPSSPPARGTKAKLAYEIEVTPDVSLVVKGLSTEDHFSELKLRRFEAIAERLRELLNWPPENIEDWPPENIEDLAKRFEDHY